ncbi:MAG TPA: glycoside hydrolase family 3 protein [Candidatus Dormibacteraeota bacterium]|nr:glycoside hydrolase family 3 protein [Candidatus Dormibacteraeota bacterium]
MNWPLERIALRCLLPGFAGTSAPDWVLRKASEGLGGVVLYGRNVETPEQLADLTAALHAARPGLLIAVDEEGGDVTRLEARMGSSYPGNLALGAADDPQLTFEVAAAMGRDMAQAGIDLDLAPVADVNTNPNNPVIGARSFGSDPALVAHHTAAWIKGLQGAGVAACAKHFPGHGDTLLDSHLALPFVTEDPHVRALEPFRSAIASGVKAIMSAHIVVRSIDDLPATVSRRVMTALLRDELGFGGLAVTDGLEMRGLSDGRGVAEGAVLALIAGCDALCIGGGLAGEDVVEEIVSAIDVAVRRGRLSEDRLQQAGSRVDALSEWRRDQPAVQADTTDIGLVAARKAVVHDGPVRIGDDAEVIQFGSPPSMAAGDVPWGVAAELAARGVRISSSAPRLVLVVRDLHRHADQLQQVEVLLAQHPDAVLVEMGVPQCRPNSVRAYVATHGSSRVSAMAAAEVMRPQ